MIGDLMRASLVLVFFFVFITACTDTRTRVVDRPDTTPMTLPEWGYQISFIVTSNGGEPDPPVAFDCNVVRLESGAAATYCGFPIYVTEDGFSFDTAPYRVTSWFYGPMVIDVDGAGDAEGADIDVRADFADVDTWEPVGLAYTLRYEIAHVGVIE